MSEIGRSCGACTSDCVLLEHKYGTCVSCSSCSYWRVDEVHVSDCRVIGGGEQSVIRIS